MERNKNSRIPGIHCDCVNCRYHAEDDSCHAKSVSVGSRDAIRCGETRCETFSNGTPAAF